MSIETFLGNLFTAQSGGAKRSIKRRSKSKKRSTKKRSIGSPSTSANDFRVGDKKKGRNGKMYQAVFKGTKLVWKKCGKNSCRRYKQLGPSPMPTGYVGGAKRSKSKKRSTKRRSTKKRSTKRRSTKKRSIGSPSTLANDFRVGDKKKGRDGKMYQAVFKGTKLVWKKCGKNSCRRYKQLGPSPMPTGYVGGAKRSKSKKRSTKRRSAKKPKSAKRSTKRRSAKKPKSAKH